MNWLSERPKNLVLPLDFACSIGGRLKSQWHGLASAEPCQWFLSSQLLIDLKDKTVQSEIRTAEALKLIEEWPIDQFCSSEANVFMATRWLSTVAELERKVSVVANSDIPDFSRWALALFPSIPVKDFAREYLVQFPEADEFPWEGLRFFSGFLRKAKPELAGAAAHDWARFQASYSPHAEMKEDASLQLGETIINPTLQILKPADAGQITLVWRWNEIVHEAPIGWREAMLIDEVSEAPRTQVAQLIAHVKSESASMIGILEPDVQTFEEVFLRLTLSHVLLSK